MVVEECTTVDPSSILQVICDKEQTIITALALFGVTIVILLLVLWYSQEKQNDILEQMLKLRFEESEEGRIRKERASLANQHEKQEEAGKPVSQFPTDEQIESDPFLTKNQKEHLKKSKDTS